MELTIDQALQQGIEAHKAGQVQEADRLYTAILKAQPKHSDANHNMGVLAVGVGKVQEALPFFKTALEINPNIAQFWLSYIDALIRLDRIADANDVLDQAKSNGAKGNRFDKLEQRLNLPSGTPVDAVASSQEIEQVQPNILDSITLDQAIKLAKNKSKEGTPKEAKHIYQDILVKFPKNKTAIDGMKALAGRFVGKASKVQDLPKDQLKFLIAQYNQGQYQEALDEILRLMQQFPNSANLHSLSGAINEACGRHDHAIESYKNVLKIIPDLAEPHYNIGNALKRKGDLEAAIVSYKKAITIKPTYYKSYYNMGTALKDQDKPDEAIMAYNKALSIKPDYVEAYLHKGNALQDQGDIEAAIESYELAIDIDPKSTEALANIGLVMTQLVFTKPSRNLQKIIMFILEHRTLARPKDISLAAISLLKFEPSLHMAFEKEWKYYQRKFLLEAISSLSKLPLLLKLIALCPLADLELERALTNIRSGLLSLISDKTSFPDVFHFQSALALQCFINEYVYIQNDADADALLTLETLVKNALANGEQPNSQYILCLASYKALHEYEWCDLLKVTGPIEEVFTRQVIQPNQEARMKPDIPALEEITNEVSSKVREQYEENPYPRWVNLGLSLNPNPISKVVKELNLRLFDHKINNIEAPNILISGCGTGQHSIGTAARFKSSKVLAIDLSLSSLAYAKRKTEELDVQNIKYMQADILDLGKLDRQFDIVESIGVLHHMDDPMAGWRVLTDCLKTGGLMKIGLYSVLARQHIVEMRKEIAQSGIGLSNFAMKSFRYKVIKSDEEHHKRILKSGDFYSMSTLRDLLFHVQEHRFTIPQIKECLDELGLKFCGFEADKLVQNFKVNNTKKEDLYNLDKWNSYEEANPNIFAGMYQFWCQKVA